MAEALKFKCMGRPTTAGIFSGNGARHLAQRLKSSPRNILAKEACRDSTHGLFGSRIVLALLPERTDPTRGAAESARLSAMDSPRSENYRRAAAECFKAADRCTSVTSAAFFRELAARWTLLAEEQEQFERERKRAA
jgi:hypothetical protein